MTGKLGSQLTEVTAFSSGMSVYVADPANLDPDGDEAKRFAYQGFATALVDLRIDDAGPPADDKLWSSNKVAAELALKADSAGLGALAGLDVVDTAHLVDRAVTAGKLALTTVTAGSYTNADITVDSEGRLTAAASGSAGEANTSSNKGTGAGLALAKEGVDLPFKTLLAGTEMSLAQAADTITINFAGTTNAVNAASNVGSNGVGVYDGRTGTTLEFRGVAAGSSMVTSTLDSPNSDVVVDVVPDQIPHNSLAGYVPDQHVAHSGVVLSGGDGITGGGNIATSPTAFSVDLASPSGMEFDAGKLKAAVQDSIEIDPGGALRLENDIASGNRLYFGFDADGNRGFHSIAVSTQTSWVFQTSTVAADPGTGNFRRNTGSWATTTEFYVSDVNDNGLNVDSLLGQLTAGQRFTVSESGDDSRVGLYEIESLLDNVGWWVITALYIDSGSGGEPRNNRSCTFTFGGGDPGGSGVTSFNGRVGAVTTQASDMVVEVETKTASYTTVDADQGKMFSVDHATGATITVHSTAAANFHFSVVQAGAGQVTISAAGTGAVLHPDGNDKTEKQWAAATCVVLSNAGTAPQVLLGGRTAA